LCPRASERLKIKRGLLRQEEFLTNPYVALPGGVALLELK